MGTRAKSRAISLSALVVISLLFTALAVPAAENPPKPVPEGPPPMERDEAAAVPAHVLAAVKKINEGKKKSRSRKVESVEGGVIRVEPGRNVNLTVSGDQLNRIVTPFADPYVHKVGKSKIKVDGSAIYVSIAESDGAETFFITEKGESDPSLSVTLFPKAVAPREFRLELAGAGPLVSLSGGKSAKWEKNLPYTEAIEKVMLGIARGEVPPGYSLRDPVEFDPRPRCRLPVRVETRQVLEGHNFLVIVSRLTNVSSGTLMMDESSCYQEGVRAVAVWPRVELSPGQSTELYVLAGRDFGHKRGRRPSVLRDAVHESPEKPKRARPRPRPEPAHEPEHAAVSDALHTPWPTAAGLP